MTSAPKARGRAGVPSTARSVGRGAVNERVVEVVDVVSCVSVSVVVIVGRA